MTNAVSSALAERRDGPVDARTFVRNNQGTLAALLPTHLKEKGEAWARQVAGSLYRGRMSGGQYDLVVAAQNNPDAFMIALRQAASLGLTPGTDEYYLTPRKVNGRLEILGIVGYQGYVELMYRAGAVSSVIVELVYELDEFDYMPGRDEVPLHKINWRLADRGKPWLVYAYARMASGAASKVIVMNEAEIDRIKKRSASARSDSSPWTTDPGAMWMKTAVRQLRKWVPTSSEYLSSQIRASREGQSGVSIGIPDVGQAPPANGHQVFIEDHDEVVDAEVVSDQVPAAAQEPVQQAPEPVPPAQQEPVSTAADGGLITRSGVAGLSTLFGKIGAETPDKKRRFIKENLGIDIESLTVLTVGQANLVIEAINKVANGRKRAAEEPEDVPLPDEPE
jgi:recombination protein RecT